MDEKIGIGVIGISFGQYVHVPAFRADPRCEVRAICATTLPRAQDVARRLDIPSAYGDARQLISDPAVLAVSIAVPPFLQPELIEAVAGEGKHVFCEKPLGNSSASLVAAQQTARRSGIVTAVDFIFPEIPAWIDARRIIRSQALGTIRHIAISWLVETRAYQAQTTADSWKTRASEGGGTLLNLVSHSAYYIEWLFGRVSRLNCQLRSPQANSVDAGVYAWMSLENGTPIALNVCADSFLGTGHRIEVYGDRGTLILRNETPDYVNGFELLVAKRGESEFTQCAAPQPAASDGRITSAAKIVRRFIDAIENHEPMTPNLEQGMRAQYLLDAMRLASTRGQWVDV